MRAPFAPPRISDPRNVRALSQAADTMSPIESPLAAILVFADSMSKFEGPMGTGSCQIRSSVGTSGPT